MPSITEPTAATHVPAWKRLGLKLKVAQEIPEPSVASAKEPATTKRKRSGPDDSTSAKKVKSSKPPLDSTQLPATPNLLRKKSVTFTPETKAEDGDSVKQLFNSWVAEQKSKDPSFELKNSGPAFTTPEPAQVEEQVDTTLDEGERRVKRVKTPKEKARSAPKKIAKVAKAPAPLAGPFLQYLRQYCEDRPSWKFNKNHQNHLLKHIFDEQVIPSDYAHFIYQYVRGLQGGVRTRIRDAAIAIKVKDIEDGPAGFPADMGLPEKRQRDYDESMAEFVATLTAADAPPEMSYEEGVLLGLSDQAMRLRFAKRMRAEKVLSELALSPEVNAKVNGDAKPAEQEKPQTNDGPQKVARKRKQRTVAEDVSSSSSEEDSSDSDSSSDDSTAKNGEQDDSSSSSSSSSSESGGEGGEGGEDETSEDDSSDESESE